MISACKTGSAKRVTVVLPLFPYSRQPDAPYNKTGAPLSRPTTEKPKEKYTFESVPASPGPGVPKSQGLGAGSDRDLARMLSRASLSNGLASPGFAQGEGYFGKGVTSAPHAGSVSSQAGSTTNDPDYQTSAGFGVFQAKRGYKQWVAQAGNLIADLLTCAGADQYVYPSPQKWVPSSTQTILT